ncbi:MAG: tRNA pseudouridine(38-40) synthase TruA [Candidatus Thermoplasmatota archaeon]
MDSVPMRFALKLAYDGTAFSGSQRQPPPVHTVEGAVTRAARDLGILGGEGWFVLGSRTDAGVCALGNVGALDTDFDPDALIPALNSALEDAWVYGSAEVGDGFNPRHAKERWYRYLIPGDGMEMQKVRRIASIFEGEHDFTHFSKLDSTAERSPVRTIASIEASDIDDFLALDVRGESFLWQMVRRIAGAVRMGGTGELTYAQIEDALLRPEKYNGPVIPPLPPQGLWLMDVDCGIEFALEPLPERFQRAHLHSRLKASFYSELERRLMSAPSSSAAL